MGQKDINATIGMWVAVIVMLISGATLFVGLYQFSNKVSALETRVIELEKRLDEKIKSVDKTSDRGDSHNKELMDKDVKHLREVMDLRVGLFTKELHNTSVGRWK